MAVSSPPPQGPSAAAASGPPPAMAVSAPPRPHELRILPPPPAKAMPTKRAQTSRPAPRERVLQQRQHLEEIPPKPERIVPFVMETAHECVGKWDVDWTLNSDWATELRLREERNQLIKSMLREGRSSADEKMPRPLLVPESLHCHSWIRVEILARRRPGRSPGGSGIGTCSPTPQGASAIVPPVGRCTLASTAMT